MSAQKQCPKCGEKNPAEAVMCWACYTSLSGGVAAPAGGAGGVGGVAAATMTDAGEKKKIEPKQLAIIGIGLVVVLGLGVKTMMGSGGGGDDGDTMPQITATGTDTGVGTGPKPAESTGSVGVSTPPAAVAPPSGINPTGPQGGGGAPPPFPYTLVAAPNARLQWATMAIVPNNGVMKESEARDLAAFADRYQQKAKKFPATEIFVINNKQSAQMFAEYQMKNNGKRMDAKDYQTLQNVWSSTPVRYLNVNGKVTVTSPQNNPSGFWNNGSR